MQESNILLNEFPIVTPYPRSKGPAVNTPYKCVLLFFSNSNRLGFTIPWALNIKASDS